jgi:outer membrane receptor protein involved in Fe transport
MIEAGYEGQTSQILFGPPGFFISTTDTVTGAKILQPHYKYLHEPGIQTYYPKQFATYLQDKIEVGDLVIRAGLRFEYFDANALVPSDLQNPANTITGAPFSHLQKTKVKTALAPRFGLNFPLTDASSVYFSYGHFYQLPGLGLLYGNADYTVLDELQAGGISYGVMGNPDLKPELTVQYEFGLKQTISNNFGAQVSLFYKDIRDLLGVEFVSTYTAAEYGRFTNVDFGSVSGFTVSLFERSIGYLSSSLDYTLEFAEGNSSDPRETANRAAAGEDSRPKDVPFDWDQRHTLNATAVYSVPDDFSVSTIIRFGSGQPYTPEIGSGFGATQEPNSARKNSFVIVDLRGEKYLKIGPVNFSIFARVFNLLGTHYANGFVFDNTGTPDYALYATSVGASLLDPSRFYEPRRIEFGFSVRGL